LPPSPPCSSRRCRSGHEAKVEALPLVITDRTVDQYEALLLAV
jgi:hypothetical protein